MIQFLLDNWQSLLSVILVILSFVLALIRKKPSINELDNILVEVLEKLPEWINSAETLKGAEVKKALVLESVKKYVKEKFSLNLSSSVLASIDSMIESILSTPQKK